MEELHGREQALTRTVSANGAHDKTTGVPVTNFKRSTRLYRLAMHYNRGLDRDKDGIACEKNARRPAPDRRRRVSLQAPLPDGDDLGEATYAQMIHVGEEIIAGSNQHFRVVDVVPFAATCSDPTNGDSSSSANGTTSTTRKCWLLPAMISSPTWIICA